MQATFGAGAITQAITATDSVSGSNDSNDGLTYCGNREYTITTGHSCCLSLTGTSGPTDTLTLEATDVSEVTGPVTITVEATLESYPSATAATTTFIIEILHPCVDTVLNFNPAVTDMIITQYNDDLVKTIQALDSVSQANGNSDGFTFCGPRIYTI